jgi:hypothetical protein
MESRSCGCTFEVGTTLKKPTYSVRAMCAIGRLLMTLREVREHLEIAGPVDGNGRRRRFPEPVAIEPPGRVVNEDGHVFQQHWINGMRGRIYRSHTQPELVGREVVAIGTLLDNNFGPMVELDGTAYGLWWGEVEVLGGAS